jgi:hypothetical protein
MFVAVLKLVFMLYDVHSLKEKRSIVKSMMQRMQNKFKVSMAEVAAQDSLERLVLGFSLLGNDPRLLESQMSKIENFAEDLGLAQLCEAPRVIESYSSLGQKVP